MKWLCAGLTFVNCATLCGLFLGMVAGGLGHWVSLASLGLAVVAALAAYLTTADQRNLPAANSEQTDEQLSKRAQRRFEKTATQPRPAADVISYRSVWKWTLAACFAIFAVRSFCWLLFYDGEDMKIQSPNNLGDLALHITYIKNFANGVSLWPDNPIFVFSTMRYPAGIDLFNALLSCLNVDLARGLIWVGLLASIATFYAFYRWSGAFGVAGFLFNGGLIATQLLSTWRIDPLQWEQTLAWKSIPLAMFVTQRGLLYAIPAGLLLLWHWREKFFRAPAGDRRRIGLPFWAELSLYASMPLFHLHTFMALSIVLAFLCAFGDMQMRKQTILLVASAFLPATFLTFLVTDHFQAKSVLAFEPGLLQNIPEFARPFLQFWLVNFGVLLPLSILLVGLCIWRAYRKKEMRWGDKVPENLSFLLPAAAIFLIANFIKVAPWAWDNLKILVWAYFLILPYLWTDLIAKWVIPMRVAACLLLFGSGFLTLFGSLAAGKDGYVFTNRGELYAVGVGVRKIPVEARFAAFPIYNHPLLLQGRKVALGYPGHLWTQGFDYEIPYARLQQLMQGVGDWRRTARALRVRYLFWGREEKINYPTSTRPWEKTTKLVNSGTWGAIYDLESDSGASGAQ